MKNSKAEEKLKNSKANEIFKYIFVSLSKQFYIQDIIDGSGFATSTVHDSIFKLEAAGLIEPVEKGFEQTSAIPRKITQKGINLGNKEIESWLPYDKDYLNRVKEAIDKKMVSLKNIQ